MSMQQVIRDGKHIGYVRQLHNFEPLDLRGNAVRGGFGCQTYREAERQCYWFQRIANEGAGTMLQRLQGRYTGQSVLIVGNGPSRLNHTPLDGQPVILLNGSVKSWREYSDRSLWLTSEVSAHLGPWFWGNEDFPGTIVWEYGFLSHGGLAADPGYSDDFLERVLWHKRFAATKANGVEPLSVDQGLYTETNADVLHGESTGTVALQAAHLAVFAGARELEFTGCELCFPSGKQHADGWQPYNSESHEFVKPLEVGGILTNKFFAASALSMLWWLSQAGIPWTDHSGGLLSRLQHDASTTDTIGTVICR